MFFRSFGLYVIALFFSFAAAIPPAIASESPIYAVLGEEEGDFLSVSADTADFDEASDTVRISGSVKITFENITLEADELLIDRNAKVIVTAGRIVLVKGDIRFYGNGLEYNYSSGYGKLNGGNVCAKGINFSSREIEFTPGLIMMNDVIASTCSLDKPDYYISAERLEFNPAGKAHVKKMKFYFKDRKIFNWPSYSFAVGEKVPGEGSGMEWGKWVFAPPSLGYADIGGIRVGAGVKRIRRAGDSVGFFADYYFRDGVFTEARWNRSFGETGVSLRLGKRYKQNTGYFRNRSPVIVWSQPVLEVNLPERNYGGSRLRYGAKFEAGRLKEADHKKMSGRLFANVNLSYPLNPGQKNRFMIISDGRFGLYENWKKYYVFGNGPGFETGDVESRLLRLQYMKFRHGGRTAFLSDLVNTDTGLFGYYSIKVTNRTRVFSDVQYNIDAGRFEEIVLGAVRKYNCVQLDLSWHTEQKRIGMGMRILTPGRD